ncbi:MAG TPA: DUF5357 family protein [Trichocoleus sp.]
MFKFLQKLFLFEFFRPLFKAIGDFLLPDQYFSWQTVIYLSLFSWAMSWLAFLFGTTSFTVLLLTSFSWLFLALGVGWALQANKVKLFGIPLAPWVAGAILSGFIFGFWPGDQQQIAVVSWPLISALIMIVPQFLSWDLDWKTPPPPIRQQVILILLISVLISTWLQFYFRLQSWFDDYPSLLAESFDTSEFVYRVPGQPAAMSEGATLLTLTAAALQEPLNNRPWPGVERWLLSVQNQIPVLRREIRDRLNTSSQEYRYWQIDIAPRAATSGYDLKLRAIWRGPTAEPQGYYLEKSCTLVPVNRSPIPNASSNSLAPQGDATATTWSELNCQTGTERKTGRPA